jgi:hypothetical protein
VFLHLHAFIRHIAVATHGVFNLKSQQVHNRPSESRSLEEQALAYLAKNGPMSVTQLYDALRVRNSSLTEYETTDLVWRLDEQGKAELEDAPPATKSLREYLALWERNLWFYLSLVASFATVVVIYAVPDEFPLVVARWVLGSVFVLFIPGYVTVEALFPKARDLDAIERFALSIGLSLALVPLIGLLLNYTPWGIRLTPIVISLTVFTIGLSLVALGREYRLSVESAEAGQLTSTSII